MGHAAREALGRPDRFVLLGLGSIIVASLILHVWGIWADLPYAPDVDEPIFVRAAIHTLQHASLNPAWFGHPGSTVIYPIAALSELWYLAAHHLPPFAHSMSGIAAESGANPTPFYVIGRSVSIAYGVGSVVATWLVGRRIIGDVGGVLAALVLPASALAVDHAQVVRTDSAGLFFALIALWLILRAMDGGRFRDWAFAAGAIGLAVSSRYFFATLVVPYGVAALLWLRAMPDRREMPRDIFGGRIAPLLALVATPAAFLATSPFVLLDLGQAVHDLRQEAGLEHAGADGLSPLGNAAWYLGEAIPAYFSPGLLVLAIVGIIVIARWNGRGLAILAAFAVTYLIGISASPLHWARYLIPLVPVVGILAAAAVLAIGEAVERVVSETLARRSHAESSDGDPPRRDGRHSPLAIGLAVGILVVLVIPSMATIAAADELRARPSTRALATDWVAANLSVDSRIAEEFYTVYVDPTRPKDYRVFALAGRPLDAYRSDGYEYLISSSAIADRYKDAQRYPNEHAFYESLAATGRLVAAFQAGPDRTGPSIRIYAIGPP